MNRSQLLASATVIALLAAPARADVSFTYVELVRSGDPAPDGSGPFGFLGGPRIDRGVVVFNASNPVLTRGVPDGPNGVYAVGADGGPLATIINADTPVPGLAPGSTFRFFESDVYIEGDLVSIEGFVGPGGPDQDEVLVLATLDDPITLTNAADTVSTTIPGTPSPLDAINEGALFGGKFAFNGDDANDKEIIVTNLNGPLQVVVDETIDLPDLPGYRIAAIDEDVCLSGRLVGFEAETIINPAGGDPPDEQAVYLADVGLTGSATLIRIADTVNDTVPGTTETFEELEEPAIDCGHVVFGGEGGGVEGIYTTLGADPGSFRVVADTTTTIPGRGGATFTGFDDDSYDIQGDRIVFEGRDGPFFQGLYIEIDGELHPIVTTDDVLVPGKTTVDLSTQVCGSLDGDSIAFRASLQDPEVPVLSIEIANFVAVMKDGFADETGLVAEGNEIFVGPSDAFVAGKSVRVCYDVICGGDPADSCDPFPDDGSLTYVYEFSNAEDSSVGLAILSISVPEENVISAGCLPGSGVAPNSTLIEPNRVSWFFNVDVIMPGEESVELYIVSDLGPGESDVAVSGQFALETTGSCIGPAEELEDCDGDGVPDACLLAAERVAGRATDLCDDAPLLCPGVALCEHNIGTEAELGGVACGVQSGWRDVWYRYRPAWNGTAFIQVTGFMPFEPVLSVHDECPQTWDDLDASVMDCNHFNPYGVTFGAEMDREYWIRVAGRGSTEGEFQILMTGPDCEVNPADANGNDVLDDCECRADVAPPYCVVDINDVHYVLRHRGPCPETGPCALDLDGNGVVDGDDVMFVLMNLGDCPEPCEDPCNVSVPTKDTPIPGTMTNKRRQ